jgi:hypothetical protein
MSSSILWTPVEIETTLWLGAEDTSGTDYEDQIVGNIYPKLY